jgi:Protein of unknown function (DUF3040)
MSARDEEVLSAAERAALAGLESKAEADDPRLAAALRGGGGGRPHRDLHLQVPPGLARASRSWLGPVLFVAGLAVMVVALSSSTLLAAAGAVMVVGGVLLSTGLIRSRVGGPVDVLAVSEPRDQDHGEGLTSA